MTVSLHDVSEVLAEMVPVCVGGLVQKIQQPSPHTIILALRRPQRSCSILISAHSQHGRVHMLHQTMPSAPIPPSFCQYCRAHLLGARVRRIVQTPGDRIVWLELNKHDTQFFLVAALTGRSANLFVLDSRAMVLRSLKPETVPGRIVGQPFTFSPVPLTTDTLQAVQEDGPCRHAVDETDFPVSQRIEETYRTAERDTHLEKERRQHIAGLRATVQQFRRRISKLTKDLDAVAPYREYGRFGELLKHQVNTLRKGQRDIRVIDYFDETLPVITLPLDPEKSGTANLATYFKKYRKYAGAQKHLVPRLEETKNGLVTLQRMLHEWESGQVTTLSENGTREHAIVQRHIPRQGMSTKPAATAYRRFCSHDGYAILVGNNASGNDVLTFTVSKPDDLWLHASGTSGAHVIVELPKRQQVPPETLKDAATLALFYSNGRKQGKGDILYAPRKYVRKPKGAKPGSVTVTRGKSVWIAVDQARLERLKSANGSERFTASSQDAEQRR